MSHKKDANGITLTTSHSICACWVISHALLSSAMYFQYNHVFFQDTINMSNSSDPDQAGRLVDLDLGLNCLRL